MWKSYHSDAKKGLCYGLSLHRKHVYNKKLKAGSLIRIAYLIIPYFIILFLCKYHFLGIGGAYAEKSGLSLGFSMGARPFYINKDYVDGFDSSFVESVSPFHKGSRKVFKNKFEDSDSDSDDSSDSEDEVNFGSKSTSKSSSSSPKFTRGVRVFSKGKDSDSDDSSDSDSEDESNTPTQKKHVFHSKVKESKRERESHANLSDVLKDEESESESVFRSPKRSKSQKSFESYNKHSERKTNPYVSVKSRKSYKSFMGDEEDFKPSVKKSKSERVLESFKDLAGPKHIFHPNESHTFKNVTLDRDFDILDLRQKNGVLTAKFKLDTLDSHAISLLDHLSKNTASCTVKWVALSKKQKTGQIHLECNFDVKAEGFSGETPINIKIQGFEKGVLSDVRLSTNGLSFSEQFDNHATLKSQVMKAIGLDPNHQCKILSVTRKPFDNDESAFKFLTKLVNQGMKDIEVIIRLNIRVYIHIKRPFSGVIESYTYDAGYKDLTEFSKMIKSRKKTEKFCNQVVKNDSNKYLLVGMNNKFVDLLGYSFSWFKNLNLEAIMTLTYVPYVKVNYYFFGKMPTSKLFPVNVKLSQIIDSGRDYEYYKNTGIFGALFPSSNRPYFRVFMYNIEGCLEENRELETLVSDKKVNLMQDIPFSENCANRDSNVLNLYYFDTKPSTFNFTALIYDSDGEVIVEYRIPLSYNTKATLEYLKREILSRLLRDGHLVSLEQLHFIKLGNQNGEGTNDNMLIKDVVDVMQEQKTGTVPIFRVAIDPKFDVIYKKKDGEQEKFRVNLPTSRPTMTQLTDEVDRELHERHYLNPDEHIHKIRVHPIKKNKVNFNVNLSSDKDGYLPPGTRSDEIAAETDLRMEIPVEFQTESGKVYKFTIHADYGADEDEIERIVKKELKKRGYKKKIPGLHFEILNSRNNDIKEFWEGGPNVVNFTLKTELANDLEVDGDVHGVPFSTRIKVHPRESMDEVYRDVLKTLKKNPKIRSWLEEAPDRESDVNTVITDMSGRYYDDDELDGNDILYNKSSKIRIGVSDHPFEVVWRDVLNGKEEAFCLVRSKNGKCKPLPAKASKYPIQDYIDFFVKTLKKEGKYEEYVVKPVQTVKGLSPVIRLKEVRTVDGHKFNCSELPPDSDFRMLEYAFNVNVSEIRSLVFGLMTNDESENLSERQKSNKKYKVVITKNSGDKESHMVDSNGMSPSELINLIYKNFSSVPYNEGIEDLKYYDGDDNEYDYDEFKKNPHNGNTLKVKFKTKNNQPKPPMPEFENVVIQPKPDETIREYFLRAIEEPTDFGLSPMHSYDIMGFDDNGHYVHFDNMLDVPIRHIKNVKKIQFVKRPSSRPDSNPEIFYSDKQPSDTQDFVTVELNAKNESVPSLNSKIRDFLIKVPPEQMGHVKIEVDGTQVKCSLETLRDAYMIKNLTLEKLFSLCQGINKQKEFGTLKLNLDLSPEEMKKSESYNLMDELGTPSGPPIANFTLYKGQSDLGLATLVKINVGTLNSPVTEFYSKIVQMFGDSINAINDLSISLIKYGRLYPCNNTKILKTLKDFGKTNLVKIFQICGLPPVIPENGSYFHFHVSINFNVAPKTGYTSSMGNTVPVDLYYDEDDRMFNIHYDENLYPDIANYINDNEDINGNDMGGYNITFKAEDPSHNFVTKTYNMNDLPHNVTLHSVFPDTKVEGLNITIDNKDGHNLGGWRSETVHPVNDFKNNFDALKRQIILNLKTMHGNNLDSLDSYVVKVGINGVKHQCHVESMAKLIKMTMNEFLKNCVNIQNVNNNPSMSFGVGYEPKVHGNKVFNVKVVCGDKTVYSVEGLSPSDGLPSEMIKRLKEKYTNSLDGVQWGAYINKNQGDCHFTGILDLVDMRSVLGLCGVNDSSVRVYNVVFYDMNYETYKMLNSDYLSQQGGKNVEFPNVLKVNQVVKNMRSPVRISMPFTYQGPDVEVHGTETLNDFVREIVNNEDEYNPGNPFKVKVHTNYGVFGVDELPKNVVNHPSRDLNGTVSFIVEDDPSGNDPGTALNLHFPDTKKTLGDFLEDLNKNPSNANKKFFFSSKQSFIPVSNVPVEFLNLPVDQLKSNGYFLTVFNNSMGPEKTAKFSVNILSSDGVAASDFASDLQEPLSNLFAKISKNQADLDKMLKGKFKIIIDGFETNCNVDNLETFQNGMTLDNLLNMCGVTDLNHGHVLTIFFETPISENKSQGFKLDVDLNDKPQGSQNVNYSSQFNVGSDVENFLKNKKDAHVYLDVKGKDNLNEFVEVDSVKFLQLLSGHPEVVDMLLKLGVPQTHLGSLDSLHLIVSNLNKVLNGHKSYNIENGEDAPYDVEKPISAYKNILELREKLNNNPEMRLKGIVTLADGTKQEFDIRGREFIHAVDGNLTFREVALRALSSGDADNVVHVNLSVHESEDEHAPHLFGRRKVFSKSKSTPPSTKGSTPSNLSGKGAKSGSESLKRSSEPASSSSTEGERSEAEVKPMRFLKPTGASPSVKQTSEAKEIKSHKPNEVIVGNVLSGENPMQKVTLFQTILAHPEKKVSLKVKTRDGKVYDLIVRGGMIRRGIENGYIMKELLQNYLMNEDVDNIDEIEISEKLGSKFSVPLKKHVQITLPVMASDEPKECEIQDFKNPWNPPEEEWKNFTVKKALEAYAKANGITKEPKAAYFLTKEDHNNMSAEILFDEDHQKDAKVLDKKIGDEIVKGRTLFIRYKDTGELAN